MRAYLFSEFGIDRLRVETIDPPVPGPGEVVVDLRALSLNYRDLMVVKGQYNPKLLADGRPRTPISDGAGIVSAVGQGVENPAVGDRVVSHFVADWIDGPFRSEYVRTSLGTPGPGLAAEQVVLPAQAVLPIPGGFDFGQAATLPIAALTAWSALVTVGRIQPGQTVLTLGTGGVSIFAVQLATALGAKVIITSSTDQKLARAGQLGADHGVNYRTESDWSRAVLDHTSGRGVDLTVETGGAGTLEHSFKATRAGGTVAFLGAVTGLRGELNLATLMMKRLHLVGIYVDSRASFAALIQFLECHAIRPVIDRTFGFGELPEALRYLESGAHFGKVVVSI